ncbi:hypothetical protein DUNSADRAFT_268 [Dunaliella salina]|uniref:Uncharacterized protein n=1 Tax=Dunaliella salina TaxID=3046 RepID=A0ABQ7FZ94_DUNSA|nr:hypothetical protein DUNSADRAFT_268 [Dunaliella salina]|eukprot:KAF5827666.1 hypothetical protein DUNSADRAFT_268 [Dunaliella salina]
MLLGPSTNLQVPNTLIDAESAGLPAAPPSEQQSSKPKLQPAYRPPQHSSSDHHPLSHTSSPSPTPQTPNRPNLLPPVQGVSGLSTPVHPKQTNRSASQQARSSPSGHKDAHHGHKDAQDAHHAQRGQQPPPTQQPQDDAPSHDQDQSRQAPSGDPSPSTTQYAHHAFIPKPRTQSAFMRRHQAAHPTPAQRMKMTGPKGSVSARTRRTAPLATFYENGGAGSGLSGTGDSWTHVSSMGDLEALDTILDTLEPDSFPGPPIDEPDMETILARARQEQLEAERQAQEQQQQQQLLLQQQRKELQQKQVLEGSAPPDPSTLRATAVVPVPILPKLARMYISSKQAGAAKAPPPPPPTAHWLVHSRPHPSPQAAPSYDTLCNQIRDVQRQYTCGTVRGHASVSDFDHEPGRPPRINPNIGMYISGLDGPALDEVAQAQGLPPGLERSRPSFVAMQQSKASSRRARSRSPGGRRRSRKASFDQYPYRPDHSGSPGPWAEGAIQSTGNGLLDGNESPYSD